MSRGIAIALAWWRVCRGHAQRICAPGQWVVWRNGDAVCTRQIGRSNAPNRKD